MTQKKADRIEHYINSMGKTQSEAAKKFNESPSTISYLKQSKYDVDIFKETRKTITKEVNARRYRRKKLTTYDKITQKLNEIGYKSYHDYINQHGAESLYAKRREWGI